MRSVRMRLLPSTEMLVTWAKRSGGSGGSGGKRRRAEERREKERGGGGEGDEAGREERREGGRERVSLSSFSVVTWGRQEGVSGFRGVA
eukprot:652043-Rhodomonas_salina.1